MAATTWSLHDRIVNLRQEIANMREQREPSRNTWEETTARCHFQGLEGVKLRQTVTNKDGGPIQAVEFGNDMNLVTMTAGAKAPATLLTWDLHSGEKTHLIEPLSNWLLCAKMEQTQGEYIGCGGMNCSFTLYKLGNQTIIEDPISSLDGHDGYISDARFVEPNRILTCSGDGEIKYWDSIQGRTLHHFPGHTSDVLCLATTPNNKDVFISGACDFTARLWDFREKQKPNNPPGLCYTFDTKSRDVQGISFFPDGRAFAVALSTSEVQLYDIRASCKLATFTHPDVQLRQKAEQVLFSSSGRLLFARYDGGKAIAYDITKAEQGNNQTFVQRFHTEGGARTRGINVASMAIQPQGRCLAIGDEKEGETVAKIFWPKESKRRRN